MSKSLRFTLAASLLALAVGVTATAARADVPPPAGFVEECTVEKQAGPGQECVLCGDSYYKTPDACAAKLEPSGYGKACRTRGASTWKEVWCKQGQVTAPSEPAAPVASGAPVAADPGKALPENAPKRGCGACRVGAPDGATGVLGFGTALGLLGLCWVRRRRR